MLSLKEKLLEVLSKNDISAIEFKYHDWNSRGEEEIYTCTFHLSIH